MKRHLPIAWAAAGLGCALTTAVLSAADLELTLVIETTDAKGGQTLALQAADGMPVPPLHVWRTDMMEALIRQPDLAIALPSSE